MYQKQQQQIPIVLLQNIFDKCFLRMLINHLNVNFEIAYNFISMQPLSSDIGNRFNDSVVTQQVLATVQFTEEGKTLKN